MPYIGNEVGNRFVASKAASVYSGNGSTTAFTLEHAVGSDEDILVSVDGVIQEPSVAYAVSSGTTLTFTAAPSTNSGNNIFVYYLFRTVATVDHPSTSSLQATDGTFSAGITATTGAFSGAVSAASVDADGGVTVDNIAIDGTEIDLSSGDLTLDVAGNIILDADGGVVRIYDGGNQIGNLANNSSEFHINVSTQDKDFAVNGNDGGSVITALTLDMSDAGTAKFNHDIHIPNAGNIYFLASSGYSPIISNSSDTNSLSFFTGNNQRMNIDANGHVTMPNQPAFFVQRSATQSNISNGGGHVTVTFDTEIFDQNADFASNTFTAPVTGRYQLNLSLRVNSLDTGANYYQVFMRTSNREIYVTHDPNYTADLSYHQFSFGVLADMDASDTAYVSIVQSGGTAQTDVMGGGDTSFSGYLVA